MVVFLQDAKVIRPVLISRFARLGLLAGLFVRIKLRIFPLFELAGHVPESGRILNLGCGNGLLDLALVLQSGARQICGMDLDARKVRQAASADGSHRCFFVGDLEQIPVQGPFDCIVVSDIFYLIPNTKHGAILKVCYELLAPGGVVLIKEMDTRPGWKYAWNWIQETLAVKVVGWTLGSRFYFRGRESFMGLMNQCGFQVQAVLLDRGSWYPHILYKGVRDDE